MHRNPATEGTGRLLKQSIQGKRKLLFRSIYELLPAHGGATQMDLYLLSVFVRYQTCRPVLPVYPPALHKSPPYYVAIHLLQIGAYSDLRLHAPRPQPARHASRNSRPMIPCNSGNSFTMPVSRSALDNMAASPAWAASSLPPNCKPISWAIAQIRSTRSA